MTLILIGAVALVAVFLAFWIKAVRERRDLELHSITPEALYALLSTKQEVLLVDVRLPLDLLADAEIIPGARRVPPKETVNHAELKDKELVVYCTCPSDATARMISRRARAHHFNHVKFLKGGLGGWKEKGYPVEP